MYLKDKMIFFLFDKYMKFFIKKLIQLIEKVVSNSITSKNNKDTNWFRNWAYIPAETKQS